ncbi:MAG: quinone-dependent dihydroorotate dehydrogenase [Bdellovibrionaceae bacterium]|nr:quinone-dependent dihydroorotate dehydrogenase [Pseudobdellovibrionaceae bacterium]
MIRKPWLWLPPKAAHDVGPLALKIYSQFTEKTPPAWRSFLWRNLLFKNRVGIAGGVDKNGANLRAWWALGCGFVEVGTVTPKPQTANPGRIIDRHLPTHSLWNRMGFPSHGADEVLANLKAEEPFLTPVFVNIGKNRDTANEDAVEDYKFLIQRFAGVADAFVVNISSPNTKGLRDLQQRESLRALLAPLVDLSGKSATPVLVKLSPDMEEGAFRDSLLTTHDAGIDGFVLTNTTLSRVKDAPYPPEGGMSGSPLKELSLQALKTAHSALGSRREGKLLVSVGGVMTGDDVFERLSLGADLVQAYSALVLEGPGFFRRVARHPRARTMKEL